MAIYRIGQASMDADGYITGYGTKWKTALTLIRPGATIVFASNPVAYATISEIINDTSLRATASGGAVVPKGDYVILLHDSLTVDGLAQDVAETLRYYQGQETMYQEFVEFLKTFDWKKLEAIDSEVKESAAAAAGSASNALQSEQNAFAHSQNASASASAAAASESAAGQSAQAAHVSESNANTYKEEAANSARSAAAHDQSAIASKNAAAASEANTLQSEQNAFVHSRNASASASAASASESASKQSETNAAASAAASDASKNESQAAAVISTNASNAASASKDAAAQSAASAKSEADRAAELATQLDANSLMRKDANLSDVADRRLSVNNLGLGWIDNNSDNSMLSSPDSSHRLALGNDGRFVWQAANRGYKNIFMHVTDDGISGSWVNLLQGNWYDGYWTLGAIRGSGSDIATVRLGCNNQGTDWKWFDFNNSYGGHIVALRGFKGQCVQGGWALDREYMGAPFYADSVANNDGGYSPVVAGGSYSSGGYHLRYSLGAISSGTAAFPKPVIHMMGDGQLHRAFEFYTTGQLYTWDTDGAWGGSFEFQRVATSDRDLKKDIEYNDGKESFDNIMKFKPSTFVYKSDKYNRLRRGVIAQDLYEIDPEYVRIIPGAPIIDDSSDNEDPDNPVIIDYRDDTLGLDNNVIMIDTALATRYIGGIVEKQQEEIDNLKAEIEELKSLIKALQ